METNNIKDSNLCSVCHQPILPTYYFCPNCGAKLLNSPLSTSVTTQLGIYLFSIILPALCFLFITRWPGLKYSRSTDSKTRLIGIVAWILLITSTFITFWYAYMLTQQMAQSINDALNVDLGIYGF